MHCRYFLRLGFGCVRVALRLFIITPFLCGLLCFYGVIAFSG